MKIRLLTLALLATATSGALAQDSLGEYVSNACRAELNEYCSTVTPGEGRLLYCGAAHSDKLSDECKGALINASMILADITDQLLLTAAACQTEIVTLCGDVELGDGRLLECLDENEDDIGEDCEDALDELLDD